MVEEKSDRKSILISVALIMFVFLLINQLVSHELYIESADYEEVCGEWETIERYEIIESDCDRLCVMNADCKLSFNHTDNKSYIYVNSPPNTLYLTCYEYWWNEDNELPCIDCLTATEPYIYTYNDTVCMHKILVKK